MTSVVSFIAALLPIAIYIFVVYKLDNFSLLSVKRLLTLVLCGMLAALACFGLFQLTGKIMSERVSDIVNPVLEEAVKAIPLLILARQKKIVFFIDSVICGAAVGGGFSLLENVFYLMMGDSLGLGTTLFRGLEVALIHMGCSAGVATAFMFLVRLSEHRKAKQAVRSIDVTMTLLLLIVSPVLHILHNAFHFNPLTQFIIVMGAIAALLVWIYQYDEVMIHHWLDTGLDMQVNLLQNIRDGLLDKTNTGQYLMSVKKSFPPEVFFDVICYVQLHVELSVAAKSRFMLREAGLDLPLDNTQKETNLSLYTEFKILEKRLGKSAMMIVAPIVKINPADQKSLDDLLAECRV